MALGGCLAWLSFSTCPSASPTFSAPCLAGGFGCSCSVVSARSASLGGCFVCPLLGAWCLLLGVLPLFVPASLTSCGLHSLTILLSLSALTLLSFRGVPASLRASACLSSRLRPWLASDPSRPSEPPPAVHLTRGFFRASSRLFGSSCVPRQSGGNCQYLL